MLMVTADYNSRSRIAAAMIESLKIPRNSQQLLLDIEVIGQTHLAALAEAAFRVGQALTS